MDDRPLRGTIARILLLVVLMSCLLSLGPGVGVPFSVVANRWLLAVICVAVWLSLD